MYEKIQEEGAFTEPHLDEVAEWKEKTPKSAKIGKTVHGLT